MLFLFGLLGWSTDYDAHSIGDTPVLVEGNQLDHGSNVQVQGRAADRRGVPCNAGLALLLDQAGPCLDIRSK